MGLIIDSINPTLPHMNPYQYSNKKQHRVKPR